MRRRDPKRDPGVLDLALRPDQALCHRLLGDEERRGDLLDGQPAERPQRERDLGVERERRMAAREDELESLVRDRRLVHLVLRGRRQVEQPELRGERSIAADAVDRAVAGGGHQPRSRAGGHPRAGPAVGRDRERLLGGFLGEVEVAEEADQAGEDATPLVAEDLFERPYQYVSTGRTSIAPPSRAAGIRDASSIAASRLSASRTKKPPIASLIPMKGPSVTRVLPSSTRTVVAFSGSPSGRPGVSPSVSLIAA